MKQLLLFAAFSAAATVSGQGLLNPDTIAINSNFDNIHVKELFSDSLVSSFMIFVKKEVKAHKHLEHSEHVYVLEGEGELLLGEKAINIKPGDLIFIPKNTVHALKVTSEMPMKVISVQAPFFDGTDRVLVE
jgi:mannose-6-phosphate isomerase-like protein (cupin superfamily)